MTGDRLVPRPDLSDRLAGVPPGGVALICAPAGSGKTVLLREWLAECGERTAWVSVERGERDAQRFWLSIVDALSAALGDGPVERVSSSPGFAGEAVVTRLLSELRELEHPTVLAIDDLHELESQEALDLLELFVAHLPRSVRLALATREEPKLGLHRRRLVGSLTELRGPDLCLSTEEARELLARSGVELSQESVALLSQRTEGWAAGLRLAALSLAGHPDPDRFLREFSGSERTVAAYLMAEVLERQPAAVRELLLRTSVLEKVCGALADELTGASGSEAILQRLADANAFVTAIDAGRCWFRYHHLFADLLRLELRRTAPAQIGALHGSAARWHERHGNVVEAVQHAQEASDWTYATRLLAEHHVALMLDGRPRTIRALLSRFPPDLPGRDAQLGLVAATARIPDAALEDAVSYLQVAEAHAGDVPAARRKRFDLELAVVKLALARRRGDLRAVLEAKAAVDAGLREHLPAAGGLRATALLDLGIAETWASRHHEARRDLEEALALARQLKHPYLEVAGLGHLALAQLLAGGRLSAALELAEAAASVAGAQGWSEDPVLATGCAVAAAVLIAQGHFDEGERQLDRAERTARSEGEPATELIIHHTRGQLCAAQRRLDEAREAFRKAERMQARLIDTHLPGLEPRVGAALVDARAGDTASARAALAAMSALDADRADVRTLAAAIALVEGDPRAAIDLLAPAIDRSSEPPRWATLEALLLDAVARDRLGDHGAAETAIERALDAAEPDRILLPFFLIPSRELLERHPPHRSAHATLRADILDALAANGATPRSRTLPLDDPLSDAELRVVRYLPSNLKMSEIASELFVSSNTVRTHVTRIYRKLGAHSRGEAVSRARELGLLAPSRRRR